MKTLATVLMLWCVSAAAMTPAALLDEMRRAAGGDRWLAIQQLELAGEFHHAGMKGRIEQIAALHDLRRASRFDLQIVAGADGYDGVEVWHADAGGMVDVDESSDGRAQAITSSVVSNRLYLRPRADIQQPALRLEADSYVLAFTPAGGVALELWVDARTYLVSRAVIPASGEATLWTDYRRVEGVMLPYRIESNNSSNNPRTIVVERYRLSGAVDTQRLAKPRSRADDTEIAPGVHTLQAHVENGHVYVEASINGAPNRLFILDTGASINVLTPDAAQSLDIAPRGNLNATGVGESQTGASLASVTTIRVGPATLRRQIFAIIALPPLTATRNGRQEPVAGLLGYDFFRRLRITIDYQRELVRFEALKGCGKPPRESVPLFLDDGRVPRIPLTVAGTEALWNLDVGDAGSLLMSASIARQIGVPADAGVETVSEGGVGGVVRSRLLQLDELGIGPFRIAAPIVAISDQKSGAFAESRFAGNVGYGTLRQFTPTFDYECRTMELAPSESFGVPAPYNGAGITWKQERDDSWRVLHVMAGSPAQTAGVRNDDVLIAANGIPAASLSRSSLRAMHYAAPGTPLRLEVRRESHPQVFELALGRFIPAFNRPPRARPCDDRNPRDRTPAGDPGSACLPHPQ